MVFQYYGIKRFYLKKNWGFFTRPFYQFYIFFKVKIQQFRQGKQQKDRTWSGGNSGFFLSLCADRLILLNTVQVKNSLCYKSLSAGESNVLNLVQMKLWMVFVSAFCFISCIIFGSFSDFDCTRPLMFWAIVVMSCSKPSIQCG